MRAMSLPVNEELIQKYRGLVVDIARSYAGMGEPLDDLIQEGMIGLVEAAGRFDESRGTKFSTYAASRIRGHIRHALRGSGSIHEAGWFQEARMRVEKVLPALAQDLERLPTVPEIAERAGLVEQIVRDVLQSPSVVPMEEETGTAQRLESERRDVAFASDGGAEVEASTLRVTVALAMRRLPERERRIAWLCLALGETQREAARRIGISPQRAKQILQGAIVKLRKALSDERGEGE